MRVRAAVSVLVTIAIAGCSDPYQRPAARPAVPGDSPGPIATAPDPITLPSSALSAPDTAREAVRGFCFVWSNWTWRTIDDQLLRLSHRAGGTLARQLEEQARLRASDESLRRDAIGSRGEVVAIDVKPGNVSRQAVCVSKQSDTARGRVDLESARHRVFLAQTRRTPDLKWVITQWQPQP